MRANVSTNPLFSNYTDANRLKVAHNALNKALESPKFFIERCLIIYDKVHVTYIDEAILNNGIPNEDAWKDCTIAISALESFISTNPDQTSVYSDISVAIYIEDRLTNCVKAYLEAGREIQS